VSANKDEGQKGHLALAQVPTPQGSHPEKQDQKPLHGFLYFIPR